MVKRVALFLLVNFLVVVTMSIVLTILSNVLGISIGGSVYGLALFCGVFGMGGAFISLAISRWMAKRAYNIKIIDKNTMDHRAQKIYNMVSNLARRNNLPMPEVGIYESPEPNAFATGPSRKSSLVAFSTGIIQAMSEEELEAVAGHEISHIANGDMVTMTLLTGVANALVMFLARIIASLIDSFLSGDEEGEGGGLGFFAYIIVVMTLESVLMMLAYIPIAAFSRYREFRADNGAAKLTSNTAMARALTALKKYTEQPVERDSYAIAKISSGRRVSLWSTHPALEDRIARLTGRG